MLTSSEKVLLSHSWTIARKGLSEGQTTVNAYDDVIQNIASFQSIEDFWCCWNSLQESDINGFSIFKEGILPMWEDPKNKNGGKFVFFFHFHIFSVFSVPQAI